MALITRTYLLTAALLLAAICSVAACQPPEKPNILFILTDDQGWPTLGCYGADRVETPNLDRLAAGGVRFTDAYVMPQCTPTRAALLTGQHTARTRMWHVIGRWYGYPWAAVTEPPFAQGIDRGAFTIAKGLRSAGYRTACLGKWHVTQNGDGGYLNLKPEAATHYGFDHSPSPPSRDYAKTGDKGVDWLTDQTIDFIRANRDRPWFAYLAHHTIHGPVVAPPELVAKHSERGAPESGLFNATYLAAIEHVDRSIGRLVSALDRLGLRENTLVVFLSDNGGIDTKFEFPVEGGRRLRKGREEYDNAPLRAGKGSPFEGGIRVPCIVSWPGVAKPGSVIKTPVHVTDWLPTLLSVAGTTPPADLAVDGVDLTPLFAGEPLPERDLYFHMPLYDLRWGATPCAVVRRGKWKLIEYFGDRFDGAGEYRLGPHLQLFDLESDLSETSNLAGQHPEIASGMRARLRAWLSSVGAEVPGPNPHHDRAKELVETREKQPWNR